MSAYGGGNLLGIILSGSLPRPKAGWYGYMIMGLIALFGIGMAAFSLAGSTAVGCAILAVLGACNGYIGIQLITALQKITPTNMLGRMMSLIMLASLGLAPISQAITGFVIDYSVEGLFIGAGILLVITSAVAILLPEVRNIGSRM
jgi:MFS family permease